MFIRLSAAIAAVGLLSGAAVAEGAKPTDPQIAHIAYTAGVIDVAAAKQALAKTSNKAVKEFAENMVRDHEAVNKQALDLVKKLKVTPEDNDTSKSLSKNAAAKLDDLAKLKGAADVRKVPKAVIRARQLFARLAPISRHLRAGEMARF
jgi:putative membrane protein